MAVPGGVTLFLAIWGAALSTFAVARESLRVRPRGKVRLRFDFIPKSDPPDMGIHAVFSNVGREPIFLERAMVRAPTARSASWLEKSIGGEEFPKLYPGQSHTIYEKFSDVEQMIDFLLETPAEREKIDFRFRVIFFDQVGRRYESALTQLPNIRRLGDGGFAVRMPADDSFRARMTLRGRRFLWRMQKVRWRVTGRAD